MFDPQRNSRRVTFWHCSTRNPLDARSRVGATFVILSDTIQNLLRTYPRYGLFPFSWLPFQDFRFVMESKLRPSKIRIVDRTIDKIVLIWFAIYAYINWRVYRSLKFYTFRRISNEIWNLISRSLKLTRADFVGGMMRTGHSWNAIIDRTYRRGFYGVSKGTGWKSDYRPVRCRNGSIVRPVSLLKWARQWTFPRLIFRIEPAKTKNRYARRWKEFSNIEN